MPREGEEEIEEVFTKVKKFNRANAIKRISGCPRRSLVIASFRRVKIFLPFSTRSRIMESVFHFRAFLRPVPTTGATSYSIIKKNQDRRLPVLSLLKSNERVLYKESDFNQSFSFLIFLRKIYITTVRSTLFFCLLNIFQLFLLFFAFAVYVDRKSCCIQ